MKKTLKIVIIAVLVVTFLVSAFMVGRYVVNSKNESSRNDEIAQLATRPAPTEAVPTTEAAATVPTETEPDETAPQFIKHEILPEYEEVYHLNSDVVGWIRIEGTKLNNPVMQTPERPNYYLKRNFDGVASDWGALYVREECDVNKPSDNVTIYGHNMRDGSMFGELGKYYDKAYWENHKLIYFDTLSEYHVYEIFSVFKTSANLGEGFPYHQMEDAADQKEFDDFVATCKKLSFYDTGITPQYGEKLICLSTCEYTLDNGRFVVAARRIG